MSSGVIWYSARKYRLCGLLLLAAGFALWKVEISNSLISAVNDLGLSIGRVVDYTDLLAIPVILLPLVADILMKLSSVRLILKPTVLVVICLSLVATTMPPRQLQEYTSVDKSYKFSLPLSMVVAKLNEFQMEEIKSLGLYVDFKADENTYYARYTGEKVAQLIDYRNISRHDTIQVSNHFADVQLSGDEDGSVIKIVNLYKMVGVGNEKDYQDKLIRVFEKKVVKELNKEAKRIEDYQQLVN